MAPEKPSGSRESSGRGHRGSVTLMALCMTTALGIALGSYITLCTRSTQFTTRQLRNDKAYELAQVGLEEALWALNENTWNASGPNGTTAWTLGPTGYSATFTYALNDQASGQVVVSVANYSGTGPLWPSITSNATLTLQSGEKYTKTLQASTGPAPLFGNAIASSDSYVSFVAGGTVDSWNGDPDNNPATPRVAYSFTAGNAANYNAVVAGNTNGANGVILTQATVNGYVSTFGTPVSYSTSGSPPGKVLGPTTPGGVNVDTTRLGKSAFIPSSSVFKVNTPAATTPPAAGGGLLGWLLGLLLGLLDALLNGPPGSAYQSGDLTIDDSGSSVVVNKPGMKLVVNGNLVVTGSGSITVQSTGSLEIYVSGDVSIGGNGIINQTGDPKKFAIFSTSASTTNALEYTTNANFCGVIYCENKPIDIRQNATFHGALLSRQYVRFSNSATAPIFHYDSALRLTRFSQITTPYIVRQLTEP